MRTDVEYERLCDACMKLNSGCLTVFPGPIQSTASPGAEGPRPKEDCNNGKATFVPWIFGSGVEPNVSRRRKERPADLLSLATAIAHYAKAIAGLNCGD